MNETVITRATIGLLPAIRPILPVVRLSIILKFCLTLPECGVVLSRQATNRQTTETKMMKLSTKIRNAVCSCSTGSEATFYGRGPTDYYDTKSQAVNSIDGVLQNFILHIDRDELGQANRFSGNEGRENFTVRDDWGSEAGRLVCIYYRMPSGRYEFVTYIT